MYKQLLILKYLRKRRIAWVSLIAVTLCTTMVIVVISVMGGWLRMFEETQHKLVGDIVISTQSINGFPHYQEMLDGVRKLAQVKAAIPVIKTPGLMNVAGQYPAGVQVVGFGDLSQVKDVNGFADSLNLQPGKLRSLAESTEDPIEKQRLAAKADGPFPSYETWVDPETLRESAPGAKTDAAKWPGAIVGVGTIILPKEQKEFEKQYKAGRPPFVYHAWIRLTVLGLNSGGGNDVDITNKRVEQYWIVDDSKMNFFAVDSNTVYVDFNRLQNNLGMQAQEWTLDDGTVQRDSARTSEIQIGLRPGADADATVKDVQKVVDGVKEKYSGENWGSTNLLRVETWQQKQAQFIGAVEHEKVLLTFLFGIMCVVAVFLIFCIFFMIVVEKTRDIGIIKSVGATGGGVAAIFMGYGFVIGVIGAGAGLSLGWVIVHYINQIHSWLGAHLGVTVWSAETYAFDTIPNTLNPRETGVIVTIAVLSGLLGAVVPAIRAARMNPVEALRFE